MFCIVAFTIFNAQVVNSVVLPDCYPTMQACLKDIPRRAIALVPETHTMIGFNCVSAEKDA